MTTPIKVGETLVCLKHIDRQDGRTRLAPGNRVNVIQEFTFNHEGVSHQDITVVCGGKLPVAVLVNDDVFRRLREGET